MWHKFLWVTLIAVLLSLASPAGGPALAQDATPAPAVVEFQKTASLPWYVGVLFFVAIGVGGTIFRTRIAAAQKKTFITGSCCVPLVEDGTRPFQLNEDLPEEKS